MIETLDAGGLGAETATLEDFYDYIQKLIGGIDNAEGRQRVITGLYEEFFRRALPDAVEALGIVYTPVEIVDFINRSVNDLLIRHFDGATLSDEGVHILDPFTGTGTFITRLIQTGLIAPDALERKYAGELHANEITLLAYYIAAMNIENAYQGMQPGAEYRPFDGDRAYRHLPDERGGRPDGHGLLPPQQRSGRPAKGTRYPRDLIGNPPYSAGQKSQNDDNQNMSYATLDASLRRYLRRAVELPISKRSSCTTRISARSAGPATGWRNRRRAESSASSPTAAGSTAMPPPAIRDTLTREFHHIYIYNLRGNARTSGEQSPARGGDQTFGSAAAAPPWRSCCS